MARSRSERGADETRDCSEGQKNLKQALIIAGSRGLGLGPVREYLVRGWQVIVTARTPSAELDALCQRFSGQLAVVALGVTSLVQTAALVTRLEGAEVRLALLECRHSDWALHCVPCPIAMLQAGPLSTLIAARGPC